MSAAVAPCASGLYGDALGLIVGAGRGARAEAGAGAGASAFVAAGAAAGGAEGLRLVAGELVVLPKLLGRDSCATQRGRSVLQACSCHPAHFCILQF